MKDVLIKSSVYAAICLLFTSISTASSATYSNLIVFGDSLSDAASLSTEPDMAKEKDIGNNYWVKTQGKIGAPITSENFMTKTRSMWPNDLIANSTLFDENPNHTRYIYPSRQANQRGYSPLRYSIDYAWASAETGDHYINDLNPNYSYNDQACQPHGPGVISHKNACVPSVLIQTKRYLSDVDNHPNPHSLFIIWAGGNDFFNNMGKIAAENKQSSQPMLLLKMLNAPFPLISTVAKNKPLSNAVKNLKEAVVMLIQAGVPAQNIYVINLPNLADTPAAQSFAKGNKTMLFALTAMTDVYNILLRINLAFNYLHAQYNLPNGNIVSANAALADIIKNHQQLGFTKFSRNCAEDGATQDCHEYIFFNGKHPTSEAHKLLADYLKKILSAEKSAS